MCGIVGIYSNKDIAKELYYSLYSIQHRGQESCGMAISNGNNINYKKDGYNFTLKQAQSSWDSVALLNNYINNEWAGEYLTTQEKGLTIYTNKGKAAWVNNGIVYTISGDSNLSNEQIRKIATSL